MVQKLKGHEMGKAEESIWSFRTFEEAQGGALWAIAHYVSRELDPFGLRVLEGHLEPNIPLYTLVQFGKRVYKVERNSGRVGPGGYILRIENPDGSREDWAIVLMRLIDHLYEVDLFGPGVTKSYRVWIENAWETLESLEEAELETQWEILEDNQ